MRSTLRESTIASALALGLAFSLSAAPQEAGEFTATVQTRDTSTLYGTVRWPAALTLKTRFGEAKVDTSKVTSMRPRGGGTWSVDSPAGTVIGEFKTGSVVVESVLGRFTVDEADIDIIYFHPAPKPAGPVADPKKPAVQKPPRFAGFQYRKSYDPKKAHARGFDPVVLLASGKHLALLDYETEECVFLDLGTGASTRVKVEGSPSSLVEKDGKVYVANRGSRSISVIDAQTFKTAARVTVEASPTWLAAPVLGNVLYVALRDDQGGIQSIDTGTNKVLGPLQDALTGEGLAGGLVDFISVTPDNRVLITQTSQWGSPAAAPRLYLLGGQKVTRKAVRRHEDHGAVFLVDLVGDRIYAGFNVYSLDLSRAIAHPPCTLTVPHPSRDLVFGSKRMGARFVGPGDTIAVLDEERLVSVAEVPLGDDILALVPTENTLYAVGPTQVYVIPLADHVPVESLRKPRARRISVDLARPPAEADVRKAEGLMKEGQAALDSGRVEDARKKFEAALAVDPLSAAKAALGSVLVRQKKYAEAIDYFRSIQSYPFRGPASRSIVHRELGIALLETRQPELAVKTLQEGLVQAPKDPALLRPLGLAYSSLEKPAQAYLCWAMGLKADPKQGDVAKMLEEVTKAIAGSTAGKCETCNGDGKFETIIEEKGTRRNVVQECRSCKGSGSAWKRPCVDCVGSGRKSTYTYCDQCYGAGYLLEPAKGKP